ncbi:MAG: phage scaffolding protein, partial [Acidobacteriota bacterium]|nr:phage scaffolding protein [Acidobacteriota bacterium]
NISGNLPEKAYVWVMREDPKNTNLLYAGTELGLFVSYTGGNSWARLGMKNLPHVAVHDIIIHPRENDLILGTHGRSIWIFDDATPIQQMTSSIAGGDAHLFDVRPGLRFTSRFTRYGIGDKVFAGPNPPYGTPITYYLKEKPAEKTAVKIEILDAAGKVISEVNEPPKEKGLNRAAWNLRYGGPQVRRPPTEEETAFTGGPRGPHVLPGTYTVRLTVGDKKIEKPVQVRLDPTIPTVPQADLQMLHDLTLKLRDMQSATNGALRMLDSLKDQLQNAEKVIKDRIPDAPKELTTDVTERLKQIEALQAKLVRPEEGLGISGRESLISRLGGLFFSMDGTNAAPTVYQREYFNELQSDFRARIEEVNTFISGTVPQINDTLRRAGAPTIAAGKAIDLPR